MRTLQEIDDNIAQLFQERAMYQLKKGQTFRPEISISYKFKVKDSKGEVAYFKTMQEAWSFFTGRHRIMNWRDAPAAFRLLGLKITKLTGEEKHETRSKAEIESRKTGSKEK